MEAIKVAKWFLNSDPLLRNGYNDENTKLNKLLYFSNLMFYSVKGENLIEDDFERWDNGSVIREIYKNYRYNGLDCEGNLFVDIKDKETLQILRIINFVYGDMSARKLSEESHKSSIWQDAEKNQNIDFSNIDENEKKLMINLYETYANVDFENFGIEKINGNKYYYDKRNIQMTDELILDLEKMTDNHEPVFLEMIDGELVLS